MSDMKRRALAALQGVQKEGLRETFIAAFEEQRDSIRQDVRNLYLSALHSVLSEEEMVKILNDENGVDGELDAAWCDIFWAWFKKQPNPFESSW